MGSWNIPRIRSLEKKFETDHNFHLVTFVTIWISHEGNIKV